MTGNSHCNRRRLLTPSTMAAQRLYPVVLTPREWQLVEALTDGHSNAQIAAQLGISPHTVRNTLSLIYLKTGSSNRVMLASLMLTGKLRAPQ